MIYFSEVINKVINTGGLTCRSESTLCDPVKDRTLKNRANPVLCGGLRFRTRTRSLRRYYRLRHLRLRQRFR